MNIINFIMDFLFNLYDIWETIKEKDEKIVSKIICILISIVCIFISAKIFI